MSNAPTLINLPPPPSDPVTPSDVPGTPNSTTTSMSELSTVAIKDGHRGHHPHHSSYLASHTPSGLGNQLDAERADRLARLTGLGAFNARNPNYPPPSATTGSLVPGASATGFNPANPASTYGASNQAVAFDAQGNPILARERSTVGSASATGSVGARTTWAGSEAGEETESMDLDTSSVGGMSDEGAASLVGFGEGARTPARQSVISSPGGQHPSLIGNSKAAILPRTIDGMTYDPDSTATGAVDMSVTPPNTGAAAEQAERIVRENMDTTSSDRMQTGQGPGDLGKFGFEK